MTRRYPLAALVAATGLPEAALGREVGIDGTTLKRAREHGLVASAAERYATRAGFHPFNVWPEMMVDAIEDASVVCAERSCTTRFVPTRKGHRFCSPACCRRNTDREWKRRRYQADPAYRAAENERARLYKASASRAVEAHRDRWRAANADRVRESNRRYREAHQDEIKARRRAYYLAHREEIIAKQLVRDRRRRAEARAKRGATVYQIHPVSEQENAA